MKTCLICDDHALVRTALGGLICQIRPETTIHHAQDFPGALAGLAQHSPDLCLADLRMPGADPLAGIAALMRSAGRAPVIVVTGDCDDTLLLALFRLGVAAVLEKTCELSVIEAAVRTVLAGGRCVPGYVQTTLTRGDTVPTGPAPLSPRQSEVLRLAVMGQSNKEIARDLCLAPSTVKTHLEHAMRLLGASNRTEAAHIWMTSSK
jgi:DNA-binding NarL/FixJ family response regulator